MSTTNISHHLCVARQYRDAWNPKSRFLVTPEIRTIHGRVPGRLFCSINDTSPLEEDKTKTSLNSLDSYFQKLQGNNTNVPSEEEYTSRMTQDTTKPRDLQRALNAYFDRLPKVDSKKQAQPLPPKQEEEQVLSFLKGLETTLNEARQADLDFLKPKNASYLSSIFVGLNVAVFLFGLASPLQTPDMVEVSLPVFLGAKINELIADGQWWRLITPMFLHDGLIHVGLGAWALLSFGPAVEYAFGSLGFCMIYFLGGAFGNLMSFFHTPAPTVGGTGPLYALVAAWGVYVLQNRNMFGKELQLAVTADLIQKFLVMFALHFAFADALPADNWTHIGATFVGILFALIAAPKVEMNVRLGDSNDKVALPGQAADLQRLLLAFATCVGVFVCLYTFGSPAANELLTAMSESSNGIIDGNNVDFL